MKTIQQGELMVQHDSISDVIDRQQQIIERATKRIGELEVENAVLRTKIIEQQNKLKEMSILSDRVTDKLMAIGRRL